MRCAIDFYKVPQKFPYGQFLWRDKGAVALLVLNFRLPALCFSIILTGFPFLVLLSFLIRIILGNCETSSKSFEPDLQEVDVDNKSFKT